MFELDPFTKIFLTVFVIVIGVFIFLVFTEWFINFKREFDYINCEIKRSSGKEREYWQKEKKKLFRSIFLFEKY